MRNYGYALAAADLMKDIGKIKAMREFGRVNAYAPLAQSIPAGLNQVLQQRDQRAREAEQQKIRAFEMDRIAKADQRQMMEFGREEAVRDLFKLVPRNPDGTQNLQGVANEAMLVDPNAGFRIQGLANEAERQEATKAAERAEKVARIFGAAHDDDTWKAAIGKAEAAGLPIPAGMPTTYSAKFQRDILESVLPTGEYLRAKLAAPPKVGTRPVTIKNADGSETFKIVADEPGFSETGAAPVKESRKEWGWGLYRGQKEWIGRDEEGNAYRPGQKEPIDPALVAPLPEKPTGTGSDPNRLTREQRNIASRWRMTNMNALDEEKRKRMKAEYDPFTNREIPADPMLDSEYNARKAEIERAYQEQIREGDAPVAAPATGRAISNRSRVLPSDAARPPVAPAAPPRSATPTPSSPAEPVAQPAARPVSPTPPAPSPIVVGQNPRNGKPAGFPTQEAAAAFQRDWEALQKAQAAPVAPAPPVPPQPAPQAPAARPTSFVPQPRLSDIVSNAVAGPVAKMKAFGTEVSSAVAPTVNRMTEAVRTAGTSPNATRAAIQQIPAAIQRAGSKEALVRVVAQTADELASRGVDVKAYLAAINQAR